MGLDADFGWGSVRRRRRSAATTGSGADFAADRGQDSGPGAVAAPAQEMLVRGRPGHSEVVRQVPAGTSGALHIQYGVEIFAPAVRWARPPTAGTGGHEEAGDARPGGGSLIGSILPTQRDRIWVT